MDKTDPPSAEARLALQPAYRKALGAFTTGVVLALAPDEEGRAHGLIVNSFTSVSLDPPIILWCIGKASSAHRLYTRAPLFSLSILASDQEAAARRFSRSGDRIAPPEMLALSPEGVPLLSGAAASFACRRRAVEEMGDHDVIFGEVASFTAAEGGGATLGYHRGRYIRCDAPSAGP